MSTCQSHRWNPGFGIVSINNRCAVGALLICTLWTGVAIGAEQVTVEASRHGTAVAIKARATIKAPYALIWQTLTDYDHLAEFIPGMATSRVIERRGNTAMVEQTGEAAFLFFTYP